MNEKQISLAKQRLMNRRFNAYLNAPKKYDGIDFTPPQGVRDAAIRALKKRSEQPPSKRGMTAVGIARARDLSNGVTLSPDTIKRMVAYFTRHEVDKQGSTWAEYGKGRQAWDGWGGDAGYTWAKKILAQMERADEKEKALSESPLPSSNRTDIKVFRERIRLGEIALYPGQDIKVLSVGKVNSRINGKTIQDVTPQILSEMVRVFKARLNEDPVIIDWNHQSSPFMDNGPTDPAQSMAYGEISDVYVKDDALYVKPLYTQAGLDLVKASEGVLYPSPEFLVGDIYAREDDPKPIGFAQLQAVTLTARPAQSKNKISRVLLMENIMNPEELKAMTADQLVALVLEKDQLVKQLEAQVEGLKSENDQLSAPEDGSMSGDNGEEIAIKLDGENLDKKKMMEDEKKMSEATALSEKAQAKLMNELNAQVTSLSEQVKTLQAEKHQAERKLVIDGLLNTGKIAPSEISAVESAYDIKDKFPAIWQSFSERKANQAINLSEKGHASTAQEISFIDQVNEIKKTKGITFSEALNVMKNEQPDAYIKHFKG
jgi:hypothetical protein